MSVEYFAGPPVNSFRFRDDLTNRTFCLSAGGEQDGECLERFVGSIAIAQYHFRSRRPTPSPLNLRERVLTIDHDSRIRPHAPVESMLAVERAVVSDIQAFGYNADESEQPMSDANLPATWSIRDLPHNFRAGFISPLKPEFPSALPAASRTRGFACTKWIGQDASADIFNIERAGQQFCCPECSLQHRQRVYWEQRGKKFRKKRSTERPKEA
jgi:hypothetical protein